MFFKIHPKFYLQVCARSPLGEIQYLFGPPLPSKKYFILPPLPGKNKKRAFRPHYRFFLGTALTINTCTIGLFIYFKPCFCAKRDFVAFLFTCFWKFKTGDKQLVLNSGDIILSRLLFTDAQHPIITNINKENAMAGAWEKPQLTIILVLMIN